jgi:WbqC-like protein family
LGKRVAVIQSNYIPWKGYFDIINLADEFVLFDDVQYTRRDWRNRNQIKTAQGPKWLSIPVATKGKYLEPIKEIRTTGDAWRKSHWAALAESYAEAAHFATYAPAVEELYRGAADPHLSRINHHFLRGICDLLGIRTTLSWSSDYELVEGRTRKIVEICRQAGASDYLSGPSARAYLEEDLFRASGITVTYMDYAGYRPYRQLFPPFEHAVTVLDLLFNEGPAARDYMLSF